LQAFNDFHDLYSSSLSGWTTLSLANGGLANRAVNLRLSGALRGAC